MNEQELREKAAQERAAAQSHYAWASHCPSIEYAGWVAAGDAASLKAAEYERQADAAR